MNIFPMVVMKLVYSLVNVFRRHKRVTVVSSHLHEGPRAAKIIQKAGSRLPGSRVGGQGQVFSGDSFGSGGWDVLGMAVRSAWAS